MLFQSLPKMNHKLITRLNLHTVKVDHTRPVSLQSPSKFCSQRFFFSSTTELSTCSKEINTFKRQNSWNDPFRKLARHLSHQSFLSFCKLQFFTKYAISQFPQSPLGMPGTMIPLLVCTHKINEKKKKRLHFSESRSAKASSTNCQKNFTKIYISILSQKKKIICRIINNSTCLDSPIKQIYTFV